MSPVSQNQNPQKGGVLALGNFDGVHRGHQAVIKAALDYAHSHTMPCRIVTLELHPRQLFQPGTPPFRLTPSAVKERLLKTLGVDEVITLPFTPELAALPAQKFIDDILIRDCGAQHIVAGFDFVFGHKRGGNMTMLRDVLAAHGIGVTEVSPFCDEKGETFSSSRTREALQQGDLATAQHILGRPWTIAGTVIQGAQMARMLGTPTANMELGEYLRPKFGVYAVMARQVGAAKSLPAIANIGNRPTVDGVRELLEFHIFGFSGDLYGQAWEVDLLHFIRPEQAFSGIEALVEQIEVDVDTAKAFFRKRPATPE